MSVDTILANEQKQTDFADEWDRVRAQEQAEINLRFSNFKEFTSVAVNEKSDNVVNLELLRLFKKNATNGVRASKWVWETSPELIAEYSREGDVEMLIEFAKDSFLTLQEAIDMDSENTPTPP